MLDVQLGNGWVFKGSPADPRGVGGVGFFLHPSALHAMLDIQFVTERIACASFALKDRRLNIISVYAPTSPCTTEDPTRTENFYDTLSSQKETVLL